MPLNFNMRSFRMEISEKLDRLLRDFGFGLADAFDRLVKIYLVMMVAIGIGFVVLFSYFYMTFFVYLINLAVFGSLIIYGTQLLFPQRSLQIQEISEEVFDNLKQLYTNYQIMRAPMPVDNSSKIASIEAMRS